MPDRFLRSCVVRPFEGVAPGANAEQAIAALHLEDVSGRVPGFDAALTACLMHESYLYEQRVEAPNLTSGVLRGLEALGQNWISRELATTTALDQHHDEPGTMSRAVADARRTFSQDFIETEEWVTSCGRFGGSLIDDPTRRVRIQIFHQVAGLLCLTGEEAALRRNIPAKLVVGPSAPVDDWMTVLQQLSTAEGFLVGWSYTVAGPDHQREFTAICTAGARRRASASGNSKKAARKAAAERMLRQHFPSSIQQFSRKPTQAQPRNAARQKPPAEVPHTQHRHLARAVDWIAHAFKLPSSAKPLLAQAFIHSSWTYENKAEIARTGQRDHGVLAFVGSHVLNYESCLAEVAGVVREAPLDYAFRTPQQTIHADAFALLGLERAILLGRGQQSVGVNETLASTVFQAMVGAIQLEAGSPPSIMTYWPDHSAWESVAALIAPNVGRGVDVSTRLQKLASACGVLVDYQFDGTGPGHQRQYTARLELDSLAMRRRVAVTGPPQPSKGTAKHAASTIAVKWFDALASADAIEAVENRDGQVAGATFVLAHLCSVASERSLTLQWRRHGLLGAALRGGELDAWSVAADRLLARQRRVQPDVERLTGYFRKSSESSEGVLRVADDLAAALHWVVSLSPDEEVDEAQYRRLIDLASIYRALGDSQEAVDLAEAIQGQVLLSRNRLRSDELPPQEVPALVVAAIERLAGVLTANGGRAAISLRAGDILLSPEGVTEAPVLDYQPTVALWNRLGLPLEVDDRTNAIVLHLEAVSDLAKGPLVTALRRAATPQASPVASAVANLLHDVKNQVAAARALSSTPHGDSRTAALAQQLAISQHLDQAAALAERVRAATSLLRPGGVETTALAPFVRRYASSMLVRLPPSVSLSVGSGADDLVVGLSEAALTAVLDNLIKNSVEAMVEGGRVALDWTHVDEVAVLEVADDGPGLPSTVRQAISLGDRIVSTKPGGNALGLLGVQSLVRRVGGDFQLVESAEGTVWNLLIPLIQESRT